MTVNDGRDKGPAKRVGNAEESNAEEKSNAEERGCRMVGLSDEEAAIVALVREFTDREVRPVVRDLEHDNGYPAKLIEQMR